MEPKRVSAEDVRRRLLAGDPPLFVHAYPRKSYDRLHLDGATPLEDFEAAAASLGKERGIVFY